MSRNKRIMYIFVVILAFSQAWAAPLTLDVSVPFTYANAAGEQVVLPAITPQSDPQRITDKFLALIRYFNEQGTSGTIHIPRGTWRLTRTLHLSHFSAPSNQLVTYLVGEGQQETVLEAAPGFQEIPLLFLGDYLQEVAADLNALHRPLLNNIFDATVAGARYGLRTQSTPEGVDLIDTGAWKADATYQPGQTVTLENPQSRYLCTTAHTSSNGVDMPFLGKNWRAYWRQIAVPASGTVHSSPLTAGPLDPARGYTQASYWAKSDQFTLDLCVKNNGAAKMDGVLAAVSNSDYASSLRGSIWGLRANPATGLAFFLVLPGMDGEMESGQSITANFGAPLGEGVHRISVQIDFREPERRLAAWVNGQQQAITVENVSGASYQFPAGTRFLPFSAGAFIFGTGARGFIANQQQDWTYAGLKISNVVRYAVRNAGDVQQTFTGDVPGDAARYFTNDASTVAYLPLQDAPPADSDYLNPMHSLVTVQHGQAATPPGKTPQRGYGFWLQHMGGYQPGVTVKDLTVRNPDARYGVPVSFFLTYSTELKNLLLEGGFHGIEHWACGANTYVMKLRNMQIRDASHAGINNLGQATYLCEQIDIRNCGRYAMRLSFCSGDWQQITLLPSAACETLVFMPPDQWQIQTFRDVTVLPEPTHQAPSKSVFTIGYMTIGGNGMNTFTLTNVRARELPAGIVLLDLPAFQHGSHWPDGTLTLEDIDFSVVNGGKLAAFLRSGSPRWRGLIPGCTSDLGRSVAAWLDITSNVLPWHSHPAAGYVVNDMVSYNGKLYRCLRNHADWPFGAGLVLQHRPEVGLNWQEYWEEYHGANIMLIHPDYLALPTEGRWVEGAHLLRIPKEGGGYTEYRCVKSGDAADPDLAKRPAWGVVN